MEETNMNHKHTVECGQLNLLINLRRVIISALDREQTFIESPALVLNFDLLSARKLRTVAEERRY